MSNDDKNQSNQTNQPIARIVKCPRCRKSTEFTPRNLYRPFCSERCRIADLGDWADGKYAVPAEPIEQPNIDLNIETDDES